MPPDYDDLFPGGPGDGPCASCGAHVNADQQTRHLGFHQRLHTATDVS